MESLSDRFKLLGVKLGAASNPMPEKKDAPEAWPIEKVVSGQDYPVHNGSSFTTIRTFHQDYLHGAMQLFSKPDLRVLSEWGRSVEFAQIPLTRIAFLDTETSGLAGGTGTYAFLVGIGYFTDTDFHVKQFFMRDPLEEPALLSAMIEWLDKFQAIVTFNGKSFDVPLLKTRCLLNAAMPPFDNLAHIDLLHLARRLWRDRLESRALGDLEREIIGFIRDQEEVPGYLIPQLYFDYLRTGDARPLAGVLYHNAIDIVSLAVLFGFMASILENPRQAALPSLDMAAVARLYEDIGRLEEAAELYEVCLASGLPETVFFNTITRFAQLRRKQGRLDLSASLWEKAAQRGFLPAYIELSKFFEHNQKNYRAALDNLSQALIALRGQRLPKYQMQIWEEEIARRTARVSAKAVRFGSNPDD